MTPGVRRSLVSSVVLVALTAVAGCSHYLLAEREPWRREAEAACLNAGAVQETPARVRISAISGPGMCGMDYPLKISALGESAPLGYTDEPVRPPSAIPPPYPPPLAGEGKSMDPPPQAGEGREGAPQQRPAIQSNALPPPQPGPPQDGPTQYGPTQYGPPQYGSPQYGSPQAGAPMSLTPPGLPPPADDELDIPGGPPHPYYGTPSTPPPAPLGAEQPAPLGNEPVPPLGPPPPPYPPPRAGEGREGVTGAVGPVEVKPPATLACPIVSALDQWISEAVQPASLHWFRQPVVGIKQISAYSCRGMNGNPNAHVSEHAFGNALDIAEFELADGRKISVQYGWRGTPEEQGFLHDVQAAACAQFTTVLAPGANVYHYNHIHVDLMRRASSRHICEPAAVPGEVAAARARARYAAQHGDPGVTGSVGTKPQRPALGYSGEDDDNRPLAVPGED